MEGTISQYTTDESNSSDIDTDLRDLTQNSNDTPSIDIPKINSIMKKRHDWGNPSYWVS